MSNIILSIGHHHLHALGTGRITLPGAAARSLHDCSIRELTVFSGQFSGVAWPWGDSQFDTTADASERPPNCHPEPQ